MPKMIVGKRVVYLEIYEIDVDKITSGRDDLDLCQRLLYSADSAYSQKLKSFTEEGKTAIRLLCRLQDCITENPVYPVSDFEEGVDEAPCIADSCKHDWGEWKERRQAIGGAGSHPLMKTIVERKCKKCGNKERKD